MYVSVLVFNENPLDPALESTLRAFNITNPKEILVPKALVIISHYSFINNYREFLKSLYSVHLRKQILPLERYITNFVDEIPRPDKGNLCVQVKITSMILNFYRPVDQYMPYVDKRDIDLMFRALGTEDIVTLFFNVLLEQKILFISK